MSFLDHWEDLQYPLSAKLHDGKIHDIWNGEKLKPHTTGQNFYTNPEHLAFSLSTDGVPIFKSSSTSLWPVYLVINNLPPSIRMNSENVITTSLWYGPRKPPIRLLLSPVVKKLEKLATVGITLSTPAGFKTIRGKLQLGVFDLPAKAAVLNMKQFNGEFGCSTCLNPGIYQNRSRIYMPQKFSLRTQRGIQSCAASAVSIGESVNGIKGYSVLSSIVDVVDSVPVDYMHAVLEGVTRWLLHRWFDSKHHGEAFYLGRYLKAIDQALIKQCPPNEISRAPRAIELHLNYWKASELRSWLLYYSLPLLLQYLPSLYFHHFALLVCAMHILLQDTLTEIAISAAEQALTDFLNLLPTLYGDNSCTANAHSLSHIPKYVRMWGPLWTHSAFGFENKNGHIKNMFHSKSSITDQLTFAADVIQTLNLVQTQLEDKESKATLDFIARMSGRAPRGNMRMLKDHIYAIGQTKLMPLNSYESILVREEHAPVFARACCNGIIYYSEQHYGGQGKRNNTICTYYHNEKLSFGKILKFIDLSNPIAIVQEFEDYPTGLLQQAGHPCRQELKDYVEVDLLSGYIHALKPNPDKTYVIELEQLLGKVVLIMPPMSPCIYAILQPNNFERH